MNETLHTLFQLEVSAYGLYLNKSCNILLVLKGCMNIVYQQAASRE